MQLNVPIIGILRGVEASFFSEIMVASFAEGLQAIEVTMNTTGAEAMITAGRSAVPQGHWLGMGTIRNRQEAERAVKAGAMFLVSPNCDPEVIAYANDQGVPMIAGALTPTEVYSAWAAGADMVKVFPCSAFGPGYIKELLGPFDHIPLVAVGGVTADNLGDYFAAGVKAVGVSANLFGKEALRQRNLAELAANVRKFINYCRSGSGTT
ncbi:MAG: bifunctional 4-hydroxy-2-oxoglutarate aldolase/2-dehydro-3-deoxy-phosphogluconate aldolase [Proteobacteria bacterium]|nr:bifunctional 4-hydroxy-2-oxoglutarate aldolase/2-dehydro-3-deoxy-phosphogluconate aldolase [Desulfobulbaceae bacterium]MBU4153075.1 bifunctional 4-hydroxy-2-oxoglutarate aldolase/2-dehydro-3-deoxy-phosphogluconate aldolase [Pseudomonadota bacterium]MDP2106148.1 bifunctional 4-hydroxy-2-oxoglutarate aldolase/2-dehydro-3-deoxy-phosphogluconate aldolase [Desulfobulbaceae bacterium]